MASDLGNPAIIRKDKNQTSRHKKGVNQFLIRDRGPSKAHK